MRFEGLIFALERAMTNKNIRSSIHVRLCHALRAKLAKNRCDLKHLDVSFVQVPSSALVQAGYCLTIVGQ